MLSTTARLSLIAATLAFAAPAFAQETTTEDTTTTTDMATTDTAAADAGTAPDLTGVQMAIDAAMSAGLIETLTSGEPYTAFVPTNTALEAVADASADVLADQTQAAELIQAYVIPGNVMAADAMTLVTDGGGTATVDSLSGAPLTLAMDGETLTVNGAPVTQPDIMLGNVTIHVIDGVYLPTNE